MTKSWKTTTLGVLGIISALATLLTALLDNDPNTVPDWGIISLVIWPSIAALFARDNSVTSEQAGARTSAKKK